MKTKNTIKGPKLKNKNIKIFTIAGVIAFTLAIHYGWILEPLFGHTGWVHAIHGRFCYIPIVIAASWFGLRGSIISATIVSLLVLPYLFYYHSQSPDISSELVEIIFYFAIAILTGGLIDRELLVRKKQEDTQLQLERAHKLSLIGQMAAGVAHEIKNPLASIKGGVEIISDETTSIDDKREFKDIVDNEIKRVDGTIKEFLKFARPKESQMDKLDLTSNLHSAIKQLESQAAKQKIQFITDIENNILINGDTEKMHQVFLNLLLNAIEASKEDMTIFVSLKKTNDNANLKICDNGVGIPEKELEKIFDPFFTTKSSGTGLGLAVVKSIIENHNGNINVTSKINKGTELNISLPLYKEP